ncbi:MAG TPA: hypothetical protein VJZ71_18755 [Phycisphaerae bacterium]|nr:hypothetical protein [Phycisphaerae bacterium]
MVLELNKEDQETLQELIRERLTDLGVEIHRTDRPAYRQKLEALQAALFALQARLEATEVAA